MYWPPIRDLFEKLADATEKVRAKARKASGSLSVSVVPTFAVQWLVPRLSAFNSEFPDIDVRLKAWDDEVDFLADNVDIAIYFGTGKWPELAVDLLMEEALFPVCSPALLKGHKPLREPADLAQHVLLHDGSQEAWRSWLEYAGVRNVKWRNGPVFSHTSMVLQAAAHGQGVAIGHSVLAQSDLRSGRLVRPFEQRLALDEGYFLVCPPGAAERPKVAAFRQWLLATIHQEQAEAEAALVPVPVQPLSG